MQHTPTLEEARANLIAARARCDAVMAETGPKLEAIRKRRESLAKARELCLLMAAACMVAPVFIVWAIVAFKAIVGSQ
jgi:hypothetical protein